MNTITVDGFDVRITHPEKILWPNLNIRKIDYLMILVELSSFILPHAKDRLLTTIRYPDGIHGKSFYQKNIPAYAPEWIDKVIWRGTEYILLNKRATLIWLGNQAALEFHTSFNDYQAGMYPSAIVFDLDPSSEQSFDDVIEAALLIHETLEALHIKSWIKTSGATGLQIYIPIGNRYDYPTARKINLFFAQYFNQKYPNKMTIERMVSKRGNKIYFDYLQMWHGKTITMVYSPRATKVGSISMPVEWDELRKGLKPENFHLLNVQTRLKKKQDLFAPLLDSNNEQNLDEIIHFIKGKD